MYNHILFKKPLRANPFNMFKRLPSIGRWNIHDGSAIEDAFEAPLSVLMFGTA